jgi:hypothetical protein
MNRSCFAASRLAALVTCAALLSVSTRVGAQTPEADELRRRGNELIDSGRAAEAVELYKRAYEIAKEPALLYNLGRAHMSLGDFPLALTELEAFEQSASPELREKVPGLSASLAELRAKVTTIRVECNEIGAVVRLRDRTVGQTPLADFRVSAGDAAIEVQKEGFRPFRSRVALQAGQIETVHVVLDRLPPPAATGPAAPTSTDAAKPAPASPRTAGYVVAGAGAAFLVTSGVFLGLALKANDEAQCPAPCYSTLAGGAPNPAFDQAFARTTDRSRSLMCRRRHLPLVWLVPQRASISSCARRQPSPQRRDSHARSSSSKAIPWPPSTQDPGICRAAG